MNTAFSDLLASPNGNGYPLINGIPILLASEKENNNLYEQFYQSQAEPWAYSERAAEIMRHEYVAEQVKDIYERLGKKLTVLDLGCSLGHITERLYPYSSLAVGLDISITAVAKAKKRCEELMQGQVNPYEFVVASTLDLPFRPDSFDVVIISDGIYEWFQTEKERKMTIDGIYKILKTNGIAIFTDYIHPSKFDEFAALIHSSAFKVIKEEPFYDRLWYRLESWLKAFRHQKWAKDLLADVGFARRLRWLAQKMGKSYSKHLGVIAQK
jgi:SAM-dependent methyltransferase